MEDRRRRCETLWHPCRRLKETGLDRYASYTTMDQGIVLYTFRELVRAGTANLCLLSPREYNHWPGSSSCADDKPWQCGHAAAGYPEVPHGAKLLQCVARLFQTAKPGQPLLERRCSTLNP